MVGGTSLIGSEPVRSPTPQKQPSILENFDPTSSPHSLVPGERGEVQLPLSVSYPYDRGKSLICGWNSWGRDTDIAGDE